MIPNETNIVDWVNTQRLTINRQPITRLPKGERYNRVYCPLAKALVGTVGTHTAWLGSGAISLPEFIQDFTRQFDLGNIPELVQEKMTNSQRATLLTMGESLDYATDKVIRALENGDDISDATTTFRNALDIYNQFVESIQIGAEV